MSSIVINQQYTYFLQGRAPERGFVCMQEIWDCEGLSYP